MPKRTTPPGFADRERLLDVFTNRPMTMTYNPNRSPPTAAPAATVTPLAVAMSADPEQALRDQYFQELVTRCRAGRLLETSIALALDECGRSRAELDDAIERAD